MRAILIALASLAISFAHFSTQSFAAQTAVEIGTAVKVVNDVDLITGKSAYVIKVGTTIHTQETVTTGKNSSSEFTMRDDTRLAVGPDSQLLLDKFVYDPDPKNRKVIIQSIKGALRFVTGNNPSDTYTIKTPTATIGVRGTMFDIYIDDEGQTVVGLLKGAVNVCPPQSTKCRDLKTPGKFLGINRAGKITIADKPDRSMLGKVLFTKAFPFLGGKNRLRGKLAAPAKLRQRIRKRAGLLPLLRKANKRKVLKRKTKKKIIKTNLRKRPKKRPSKPAARHNRARSNYENGGGFTAPRHRRSTSRRENNEGSKFPTHRKSISRYQNGGSGFGNTPTPRHRKSTSRRQPGGGKLASPTHRKNISKYQLGGKKRLPKHNKRFSDKRNGLIFNPSLSPTYQPGIKTYPVQ